MAPRQDWNLKMVCARQARRHLPKLGGSAELIDWGDIQVGHLDTGYTEHEVFGDWTHGAVWLRVDAGLNLREPSQKPLDPLNYEGNPGHGTRTCSVLCGVASDPNFDSEIGVAPRLPVVPCRIVNRVVLTPEIQRKRVAAGIRHALAQNCAVVSMSLGIPTFWETGGMGRAVDEAYEAGLILVGAGGQVIDRVTYPGKYKRTIGVGGVTRQRRIWHRYESTWPIDVWAPAADVLRANSRPEGSLQAFDALQTEGDDPGSSVLSSGSSGDSFGTGAGTSYATVHVAAAAAMWLRARDADIAAAYDEPWQRVEAFRSLLKSTAQQIRRDPPKEGTGILDIDALLRARLPQASGLQKASEDADMWL